MVPALLQPRLRDRLLVFCLNTYFSGGGHPVFPLLHSLVSTVLVRLPQSWYLSRLPQADLFHVGVAAPLASLVSLALCALFLHRIRTQPD